ncbi:hypothetical protein E4U61_007856, partial [Claviceps capensis]
FLTYISDTLGETHKERRAGLNLVKMRQGQHESLHAYASRWECTLFEAGSQHFSDHVRIILLSGRPAQRVQNTTGPRGVASCLRGLYGTPSGRGFDGVFSSTAAPV